MQCRLSYTFDYCAVMENLTTMCDANRFETGETRTEYYYAYEDNVIEISALAGEMWQQLSETHMYSYYPHFSRPYELWDCVVATLEGVSDHRTLCAISGEDEMCYSAWEDEQTREKYRKKLKRLTKDQLMQAHSWVNGWLARYMDLRAAYEAIYSVVTELEFHNSMLKKDGALTAPGATWTV